MDEDAAISNFQRLTAADRLRVVALIERLTNGTAEPRPGLRDPRHTLQLDAPLSQADFDAVRHGHWSSDSA